MGNQQGRGAGQGLMAEGSPSTLWVRRAGQGQSLGKHHIGNGLLGSIGYLIKLALWTPASPSLFFFFFFANSDIRNLL